MEKVWGMYSESQKATHRLLFIAPSWWNRETELQLLPAVPNWSLTRADKTFQGLFVVLTDNQKWWVSCFLCDPLKQVKKSTAAREEWNKLTLPRCLVVHPAELGLKNRNSSWSEHGGQSVPLHLDSWPQVKTLWSRHLGVYGHFHFFLGPSVRKRKIEIWGPGIRLQIWGYGSNPLMISYTNNRMTAGFFLMLFFDGFF